MHTLGGFWQNGFQGGFASPIGSMTGCPSVTLTYPRPISGSQPVTVRPKDFHIVDSFPRAVRAVRAAMLDLPIWFVTERTQETIPPHPPCDKPGAVIAFSTTEKLTSFLAERRSGEWKLNLVADRAGLVLIIALAHNQGMESIVVDPDLDEPDGQQVLLNDLLSLAKAVM